MPWQAGEMRSPEPEDRTWPTSTREEMLSTVLALVMTREEAAELMGERFETPVGLWPSSLFRLAASEALRRPSVWRRCEARLTRTLGDGGAWSQLDDASLLDALHRAGRCMGSQELAAALWLVVRRNPAGLNGSDGSLQDLTRLVAS
jgi:hypothetical protein